MEERKRVWQVKVKKKQVSILELVPIGLQQVLSYKSLQSKEGL